MSKSIITTRQVITMLRADRSALLSKPSLTARDQETVAAITRTLSVVTRAYRGEVAARKVVAALTK